MFLWWTSVELLLNTVCSIWVYPLDWMTHANLLSARKIGQGTHSLTVVGILVLFAFPSGSGRLLCQESLSCAHYGWVSYKLYKLAHRSFSMRTAVAFNTQYLSMHRLPQFRSQGNWAWDPVSSTLLHPTPVKGNPAFLGGAEGGAMYQILWELDTGVKEEDNWLRSAIFIKSQEGSLSWRMIKKHEAPVHKDLLSQLREQEHPHG